MLIETKMVPIIGKRNTFEDLYRIFKNTRRGLDPKPERRGEENPYLTGKREPRGFPLIVLALAYPQSLQDSFKDLKGLNVNHWVRRYSA